MRLSVIRFRADPAVFRLTPGIYGILMKIKPNPGFLECPGQYD